MSEKKPVLFNFLSLRKHNLSEGIFLVRESKSQGGLYVLSVAHKGQVLHYEIKRRDWLYPLFSFGDAGPVFHGIDGLINYFKTEQDTGLSHE